MLAFYAFISSYVTAEVMVDSERIMCDRRAISGHWWRQERPKAPPPPPATQNASRKSSRGTKISNLGRGRGVKCG